MKPWLNKEQKAQFDKSLLESWGKDKYDSITSFHENVLLSAGAGCGKTTTLSIRVLYQFLVYGISVSNMLILTFTNNSAREMKERIKKVFLKESQSSSPWLTKEAKEALKKEALVVDTANISTFDSFANALVRKYADLLSVSPDFSVVDKIVTEYKFNKILLKIIDDKFEKNDPKIQQFFKRNLDEDNQLLIREVKSIQSSLPSFMEGRSVLNHWKRQFDIEKVLTNAYKIIYEYVFQRIQRFYEATDTFLQTYSDAEALGSSTNFFQGIKNRLSDLLNDKKKNGDYYGELLSIQQKLKEISFTGPRKKRSTPEGNVWQPKSYQWFASTYRERFPDDEEFKIAKDRKDELKDHLDRLVGLISGILKPETAKKVQEKEEESIQFVIDLYKEAETALDAFKKEHNAYTFKDIQEKTILLLNTDELVRSEVRNKFQSIMVDEYQDSDFLQEHLLGILGTTEANFQKSNLNFDRHITFMVGDVKQSIYGFRNAKPELFLSKYNNPVGMNVRVIKMNANFRSSQVVINNVNSFFNLLMTSSVGGVDYRKDTNQQILYGNHSLDNINNQTVSCLPSLYFDKESLSDSNPTLKLNSQTAASISAYKACEMIKKVVDSKAVKLDGKEPIGFKDFAVLVRRASDAIPFVDALNKLNVPYALDIDNDLKSQDIFKILQNLIRTLSLYLMRKKDPLLFKNHPSLLDGFKHSIASVERSFLLNVKDFQLVEDMKWVVGKSEKKPLVIEHLDSILKDHPKEETSLLEYLFLLIEEFDIYSKIARVDNADETLSYFYVFISLIESLSKVDFSIDDVYDFFKELNGGSLNDSMLKEKTFKAKGNSVILTTIHKSKGLEYPFVLLPMNFTKKNNSKNQAPLVCHPLLGFFEKTTKEMRDLIHMDYPLDLKGQEWDPALRTPVYVTPQMLAYSILQEQNDSSETLRLMYVAMTRAKIETIFSFTADPKEEEEELEYSPSLPSTLFEFASLGFDSIFNLKPMDVAKLKVSQFVFVPHKTIQPYPEGQTVSFTIFKEPCLPATLFKEGESSIQRASEGTPETFDKSVLDYGTHMHSELELLDWSSFPKEQPSVSFIKDLKERREILDFIQSPFMKRLGEKNPVFYQEFAFVDPDSGIEGYMDLLVQNEEGITIIDYKLSTTNNPAYQNQLRVYRKNASLRFKVPESKIHCYLYSILKREFVKIL